MTEMTPRILKQMEKDMRAAYKTRAKIMRQQLESGMSQREIAKYWDLDPARVNRLVKKEQPATAERKQP